MVSEFIKYKFTRSPPAFDIIQLYESFGYTLNNETGYNLIEHAISKSFSFIVAENVIGQVVGMGAITSFGIIEAQLRDVIVLPEYRKQGIGSKIMMNLVKHCHERGIMHVGLLCAPHNVNFYKGLGFIEV